MQLPGSPAKRSAQGGGASQPQPQAAACNLAGHRCSTPAEGAGRCSGAPEAPAAGCGPEAAVPAEGFPADAAALAQLLQQLSLNSAWQGLLLRSLRSGPQAASAGNAPATASKARTPAPAAAAPAPCTVTGGGAKPFASASRSPSASPRIAARRRSSSDVHSRVENPAPEAPAAARAGQPCKQGAAAVGGDTVRQVISRSRRLIQHHSQAATRASAARVDTGEPSDLQAAGEQAPSPSAAAAPPGLAAEDVVAGLECRQQLTAASSARLGDGAGAPVMASDAAVVEPQASCSTVVSLGGWEGMQLCNGDGIDSGGGEAGASPRCGAPGGGSPSPQDSYESDFESASLSASDAD